MNVNWKQIGKMVIKGVVTACVGAVIDNAVGFTTPIDASKMNRLGTKVGGYVLSAMIGEKAGEYVEGQLISILGTDETTSEETPKTIFVSDTPIREKEIK